jgi:hypothetical protein
MAAHPGILGRSAELTRLHQSGILEKYSAQIARVRLDLRKPSLDQSSRKVATSLIHRSGAKLPNPGISNFWAGSFAPVLFCPPGPNAEAGKWRKSLDNSTKDRSSRNGKRPIFFASVCAPFRNGEAEGPVLASIDSASGFCMRPPTYTPGQRRDASRLPPRLRIVMRERGADGNLAIRFIG